MNWDYIAGYFDGEGSAHTLKNGAVRLTFANTHKGSLEEMRDFMSVGKIYFYQNKKREHTWWVLGVHRIDDLKLIVPELQSRCIIKRPALDKMAKALETKKGRPTHGITTEKVDEILFLHANGHNGYEIAEIIGCHPTSVYRRLKIIETLDSSLQQVVK